MSSHAILDAELDSLPPRAEANLRDPRLVRRNNRTLLALLTFVVLAPLIVVTPLENGDSAGEGNLLRQIVYTAIFAVALYSARVTRRPAALLALPVTVLLMLGWCSLSIFWAVNPAVSARRLFLTLIIVWSVFLLVRTAGYEKTVQIVRRVLIFVLAANWAAVLALPSWAIHHASTEIDPSIVGTWRGILMHKNFAGVACALTIIFFTFDARNVKWPLRLLVIAVATGFLYQTSSKTSLALVASSFVMVAMYRLYKPYYRWAACIFLILIALLAAVLAHEYWDRLTEPFSGKDNFTGRVHIWHVLVQYWQDHWLLGSGFGSFWNVGEPRPISLYASGWVANSISSGHSGFLDILVQTGLPGLVLAAFATALAPLSKFVMYGSLDRTRASLLLACIWFCVCHNLTESSLFDRDATVHVFLMLAIALLSGEARRQ